MDQPNIGCREFSSLRLRDSSYKEVVERRKSASNAGLLSPSLKGFGDDLINETVTHTRKKWIFQAFS